MTQQSFAYSLHIGEFPSPRSFGRTPAIIAVGEEFQIGREFSPGLERITPLGALVNTAGSGSQTLQRVMPFSPEVLRLAADNYKAG